MNNENYDALIEDNTRLMSENEKLKRRLADLSPNLSGRDVDTLDLNSTRLDLVTSVVNASPQRIARLASVVLTSEPVAVEGSWIYINGIRVDR